MESLRERKKAATRQAISDVATRLFEEHGFEQVTVAQIAEAANVSVKTIFNYFGTKEELFFDADDRLLAGYVAALRDRGPGVSPTQVMRASLLAGPLPFPGCRWSDLNGDLYDGIRRWVACERASPTLSARRLVIAQSWVDPLGEAAGSAAWAAMCVAAMMLRQRVLADALLERRTPRTVERRVKAVVVEAFDALERGFANGS